MARLVLNPYPRKSPLPENEYWVVLNGKPYVFVGTSPKTEQAEASAFRKNVCSGPTLKPSKKQWDAGYLKQFGA